MSTVHHRLLVSHPAIVNFTWTPSETFAATPLFLAAAILLYVTMTFLLPKLFPSSQPLPPSILRPISAVHNLTLTLLSLAMSVGCSLAALSQFPDRKSLVCLPIGTPPSGPIFFWAYVFYLSKYLELVDTFLIILGGSASRRRLSFLHVYHHATVLVMCYLWLETRQSLFPIALVTNASVHVVMYSYYFLAGVGIRPRWKRAVTDCQILQFVFSFVVSGLMLWEHFVREGCSGFSGWCFNAVFNASLLALFLDFHGKNYEKKDNGLNGDKSKSKKNGLNGDKSKSKRL